MITQVLNRLKLWQKIGWLVLAMAIPVSLVGFFYLRLAGSQVSQARGGLDGAHYLQGLSAVEGEMLTHRTRAFVFLSGDAARRGDVVAQQEEVEKQIAAMDALNADLGAEFGVADKWESVKSEWEALKAKAITQSVTDSDASHAALTDHLQQLMDLVGARSKTSLDPEVTTHALIHLAADYAPKALIYAGNMRRFAVKAAAKGYLGGDDRMGIQIYRERFHAQLDEARAALEQLPADTQAVLRPDFDAVTMTSTDYDSVVQTKLLAAANLTATGAEMYDAGVATNRAIKKLSSTSFDATVKALGSRLMQLSVRRNLTVGIGFLVPAFGLALAAIVS